MGGAARNTVPAHQHKENEMTNPQAETLFTPIEAKDITPRHIAEAVAFAERHDRNLARRNSADAIPVSAYQLRLLSLVVKFLAGAAEPPAAKPELVQKPARQKAKKPAPQYGEGPALAALPKKKVVKAVAKAAAEAGAKPPLTDAQQEAYLAACSILGLKKVVTSRGVAEVCKWGSHNTAARHLRTLVDLGYLKKVGKQGVLTVA